MPVQFSGGGYEPEKRWAGRKNLDYPILTVLVIAVAAPLIAEAPIGLRIPAVVIEMLLVSSPVRKCWGGFRRWRWERSNR